MTGAGCGAGGREWLGMNDKIFPLSWKSVLGGYDPLIVSST